MSTTGNVPLAVTGRLEEIVPFACLINEESYRDRQARDALFLTFNVDLPFLEARLLGLCQAAGACVTVLADAGMWAPDLRSVRFAGRHYHVGLVALPGAFHPKLTVLGGAQRTVAIVGSGNLSLGGWQYNAELATVLVADRTAAPRALADLRDVLQTLVQRTPLDPTSARAVSRCAEQLATLLDQTNVVDTGHRIVASWDGPLIDQLPTGPVDELLLTAPFHDQGARAVRALLERLQPRRVKVAVQPGWTELNPSALGEVLSSQAEGISADLEVIRDREDPSEGRYRHGKLIEWATTTQRHALTGSPNLSAHALMLDPVRSGGNYELAVVGPLGRSLFPCGEAIDLTDVPILARPTVDAAVAAGPIITGVARTDRGIHITLARVTMHIDVQTARLTDEPDEWVTAGTLESGSDEVHLDVPLAGGSRVRLAWTDPDGRRHYSSAQFVTDPRTAQRPPGQRDTGSRTHQTQPNDLWGEDLSFLNIVMNDLTAFAAEMKARKSAPPHEHAVDGNTEIGRQDQSDSYVEPWLWIQADTIDRLGPGLAPWVLGLPPLPADTDEWEPDYVDTAVPDSEVGLDEDTAESAEDLELQDPFEVEPATDHSADPESLQRGRRRWCERAATLSPTLPIALRLFVLRVTLWLWRAGNWPEDDPDPIRLLDKLIRSLDSTDVPEQLEIRVSTLAAIAMTFLREQIDLTVHDERTLIYNKLIHDCHHLLSAVDPELTRTFLNGLVRPERTEHWLDEVDEMVYDVVTADPLANAEDTLSIDFDVDRPAPRQLHFSGRLTNPAQRALEVVGQAEDRDPIAIWASNAQGDWALVVWRRPDLVTVTQFHGRAIRWRHQRLTSLVGPAALAQHARLGDSSSQYDILTTPRHRVTDEALAVLASVGIEDPSPPISPS